MSGFFVVLVGIFENIKWQHCISTTITRALKCETLGAILHYSLLASFTGSYACFVLLASMHMLLASFSCSFSNWLGQANFALFFSWLDTHVHTRFTHFQPWWYISLAYLARRHDQQQLTNSKHLHVFSQNGRVYHVYCACATLCARA